LIERLRRPLRRHGVRGVARIAGSMLADRLYLQEEFVWYELELAAATPRELPAGMELVRVIEADIDLAEQTGKGHYSGVRLMRAGHDLWVVREGDRGAFSCWTYRGSAPVVGAPRGWLQLPEQTICLEDSVTMPDFRGKGVAPAAWAGICAALLEEGCTRMITKVHVENAPSRKACLKAGFEEVGEMRFSRVGPREKVSFSYASTPVARLLEERLTG
jgi:GNAT superfamily N-acetyltransferase